MAMRRRIKVGVNLSAAKRKPKSELGENSSQEVEDKVVPHTIKDEVSQSESTGSLPKTEDVQPSKVVLKTEPSAETHSDDTAFKCPPKVEFNRSNSYTTTHAFDELNQSEMNDGAQVMQMDLHRSANGFPMSPSKTQQRQRIKPTPIFGQRRNSLVGPPPSPLFSNDCDATEQAASPQRRERHYSGSQSLVPSHNLIAVKVPSHSTGRIRTESTCSVFSDSHMSTTSKTRKVDDHNTHRSHTRRDFESRFSNGVPEKSSLKMFDLIYYNPATNPMEQKPKIEQIKTEAKEEPNIDTEVKNNDNSAVPVPQLKLNAKGELILDDKSLEIETTAEQEARKVLAKSSLIYLDENTGMNGFYKRQKRTRDWPADETIRFYRCLKTIGTDFSMMCQLFPKRTRRDLKLKFKKEERCNGALINKALLHPNSFNIQELKDQFQTEDRQREEEERTKNSQRSIQYRKINIKTSKSARALKNADDIYNHELLGLETKKNKKQRKEKKCNKKETTEDELKPEKPKLKKQPKKVTTEKTYNPELDVEPPLSSPVKSEPLYKTESQIEGSVNKEPPYMNNNSQIPINESTITSEQATSGEMEYVELLPVDESEYDHTNQLDYMDDYNEVHEDNEFIDEQDPGDSRTFVNMDSGNVTLIRNTETLYSNEYEQNVRLIQNSELVENDIATLTDVSADEVSSMPIVSGTEILHPNITQYSPVTENIIVAEELENSTTTSSTTKTSYTKNDETEIMKILEDIANGSLVVVSTFNPNSPDELNNEIYMLDRNTGELCEEPLDLPQEIIQSILSVMT